MKLLFFKVIPDTHLRKKANPWQEMDMHGVGLRVREQDGKPTGLSPDSVLDQRADRELETALVPVCPFPAWRVREDTVHPMGLLGGTTVDGKSAVVSCKR